MSNCFAIDITSNLRLEESTTLALCEVIDTPRALTVSLLIRNQEYRQLVELEIDPSHYEDHQHFADDYLVSTVLSKSSSLPLGIDRKQKALDSFFESEARCRELNESFTTSTVMGNPHLLKAKRMIQKVLGPLRTSDLNFVERNFRFGPGATTGVRGTGSVLSDKYDEEIHLTADLYPFYRTIIGDRWWEHCREPKIVEGNKFTTVPKSAKTDRGICIEPTLNIYVQLGIGALLRKRLLRLGVDLTSQERNQELARRAYSERLATIDLSAASDSLSWKVTMEMIPYEWFELLCLPRSHFTQINGKYFELSKFSSMGNGYTFELESLIFSAVAFSVVPIEAWHLVTVYGDDIIVPQRYCRDVINALEVLGFQTNEKKSFLAGSFFESCGTDWFKGQNVRPFYLRRSANKDIPYSLQIVNSLRLYSYRRGYETFCDRRFFPLWLSLVSKVPRMWRACRVPPHLGDTGIIDSVDFNCAPRCKFGWEGWIVKHITLKPKRIRKVSFGRWLAALACPVPDISTLGFEPRRGFLGRPRPSKVIVSQWPDGLGWA